MRPVRTISREVFVTPQRLNARHPSGMVRQSDLPGNRKLNNQRLVELRTLERFHANAIPRA